MTRDDWRHVIEDAVRRAADGNAALLIQVCGMLEELDETRDALRNKGYGYSGMPLRRMVDEVPSAIGYAD